MLTDAQRVARVRALLAAAESGQGIIISPGFTMVHTVDAGLLRRALDGCPTCEVGPVRETVGMVCQACGTDYGAVS